MVRSLNDLQPLLPTIEALAVRHRGYGVTSQHYDTVGQALLWTLEQGLREDFTTDVKQAWETAYSALSGVMRKAAYNSEENQNQAA